MAHGKTEAHRRAALGAAALLALLPGRARAQDVVELVDGSRLEGRVVLQTPERVVLRKGSRDRELARDEVRRVESVAGALAEALETWQKIEPGDHEATLALARSCRARGLAGEASVLAQLVAARDPRNEAAHLFLEHEKRGEEWIARQGKRRVAFEDLLALPRDWDEAWNLRTTHYDLTTNLGLAEACELALELELFYAAFFRWFGPDLGLYEVVEPMVSRVHADKTSFPEGSGRSAYFDGGANELVQLAQRGDLLATLAHEATHQIFHNTAVATRAGRGLIPSWLNEGLAEHMSACREGPPGHARYDETDVYAEHFAHHRAAKDPYDLARLLTFGPEDFAASSKADLKYAQAYTLVHFCLRGAGGAHRAGFLEFVRGAYRGQASTSDFRAALGMKEHAFEAAWTAYVASGG